MRAAIALVVLVGACGAASAEGAGPEIVIPSRAGVPIVIGGVDASYSVVESDWGLGHGNQITPTVYGGRPYDPDPHVGHYYPSSGRQPGYGRFEIEPPGKPRPAEPFHQSWSVQSQPQPDPLSQQQPQVPFYPPPVINAPRYPGGDESLLHGSQQPKNAPPRTPQP